MKKIFFLASVALMALSINAQDLLLEEYFEYEAGSRLISDTITSADNFDGVTGWSSVANKNSGLTRFTITDAPLTYDGYAGSGMGNALLFTPQSQSGQSVFKNWGHGITNDTTIYIAFMIQFPKQEVNFASPDYFMAIKMEPAANSSNFAGRLYASVEAVDVVTGDAFTGQEVAFGINKSSDATAVWTAPEKEPYFTFDQTYLVVMKYHVGKINGATAEEEKGKYDDEMWLYINPALGAEPTEANLYQKDPNGKDAYRLSSKGKEMGSLRGFYLRGGEPGKANSIAPYILDGIRVGYTWEDVVGKQTAIYNTRTNTKATKTIENGQLIIRRGNNTYSILGTEL